MAMDLTLLPSEDTALGKAMLSFWRWWMDGLRKALPSKLFEKHQVRNNFVVAGDSISVLDEAGKARLTESYRDNVSSAMKQEFGKVGDNLLVLQLDKNLVLHKRLEFPKMTEADIQQALSYHLSSATPFQPDQLFFDYKYTAGENGVWVDLIAIPKNIAQPAIDFIAESGRRPDRMATVEFPDINLLPHERKSGLDRKTQWRIAGFITLLLLLLAIAITPVIQKRAQVILLNTELDVVKKTVDPLVKKRQQVLTQYKASKRLAEIHQQQNIEIGVLEQLSQLVPDNSWLVELRVDADKIKMRGQSSDAVALLEILQNAESFTDAHFLSPVSTNRKTGEDSFYIEVSMVGHK